MNPCYVSPAIYTKKIRVVCSTPPKKNGISVSLHKGYINSSTHKSKDESYFFSTFVTGYFYLSAVYCIFIFSGTDTVYLT